MQEIKIGDSTLKAEIIKFSENPIYYGCGFQVGTKEWKLLKNSDDIILENKKYKIKQHVDVGDYTWFLFTRL